MYVNNYFQHKNSEEIKEFISHNGFAILITQLAGKLLGTHIPLQLANDGQKLYGHISKANPQWKSFTEGTEVLAIFSGPHAYVSSSWYSHENVPTWNYIAVHVYGTIKMIEGEALYESLRQLVDKYERQSTQPVSLEKMSADYVRRQMQGIIGFEITISDIQAAYKLSQNRDHNDYHQIIHELTARNEPNASLIAEAMRKNSSSIKE
jgi:transcriptional regulator